VLLPVYNAHHNLERNVADILEVLAEISDQFELCIVDDGSTDDTAEVTSMLANCYPQVRVIRHPVRLGLAETIQTGLDNTQGEFVLFSGDAYSLAPDDLRMLWQMRDCGRRLAAHAHWLTSVDERWTARLQAWTTPRPGSREHGFQVIRRATFDHFRLEQAAEMVSRIDRGLPAFHSPASIGPLRPNFLDRIKRFAWLE
jgi:glycosyltransferase involved in cell wall biosynthesis